MIDRFDIRRVEDIYVFMQITRLGNLTNDVGDRGLGMGSPSHQPLDFTISSLFDNIICYSPSMKHCTAIFRSSTLYLESCMVSMSSKSRFAFTKFSCYSISSTIYWLSLSSSAFHTVHHGDFISILGAQVS